MAHDKLTVLINGMGNIGTTVVNLVVQYKNQLSIGKIYACKRSFFAWNAVERKKLTEQEVIICSTHQQKDTIWVEDILPEVNYIFEATANGVGLQHLTHYKQLPNLIGASAQGSEKGFGVPFMSGVNNRAIAHAKFVNVVSCNTHGTAALLQLFCGEKLENLAWADVVVVRRSEDLGNHQRLVTANVVARHLNDTIGTHHAIDVVDLFKTIGISCALTSSDITTPSQLMHSVRFTIQLKQPLSQPIDTLIQQSKFNATTTKFDSNVVFELGRRYGFNGRIFSHTILLSNNLLTTEKSIKGWAFVPQEGNTVLSTIHAYILQVFGTGKKHIFDQICTDLLHNKW